VKTKALALASAVIISATTGSFAQSLPNFGAYAPGYGDSYGKPVSGTHPPVGYGDMLILTGRTGITSSSSPLLASSILVVTNRR
jgi:hypothetical protein